MTNPKNSVPGGAGSAPAGNCPREAVSLLEWLSSELVDAFTGNESRRKATVVLSRADHRRLRTLMAWLRRYGHVSAGAFPELPTNGPQKRKPRGKFRRGRCMVCQRVVSVRADGTARPHRGSEACRYNGGQDVELIDVEG